MNCSISISLIFVLLLSGVFPSYAEDSIKPLIYYFHGKILEDQGIDAYSQQFGKYEYNKIVDVFRSAGFKVKAEIRSKDCDVQKYADRVAKQIRKEIDSGVPPSKITLLGGSKGAVIAMAIQNILKESEINVILLAGMFRTVVNDQNLQLYGRVLHMYDKSDYMIVDPTELLKRSKSVRVFKNLSFDLGVKHGFLFRPYSEWVNPALKWAGAKKSH